MNMSQPNPMSNISANHTNPQMASHLIRANQATGNQNPFHIPQQAQQNQSLQRRMAISHDSPDINRQYQMLNQNRGLMMGHQQQPGQPQQQRQPMMPNQMAGMPIQNTTANMIPPQQQHPFTSPNLNANVAPQRGPSPQIYQHTSYEQIVLRMKQMQEDISKSEMEMTLLSRTRPSMPEQIPLLHKQIQQKRQQFMRLQSMRNSMESGGQLRQK
jgi:hypothetical protein